VWEQTVLPLEASRYKIDVLLNPGFTAPVLAPCRSVTVFHDLQHKRHPEFFRWFDVPFWRLFLWASAHRAQKLIAVSEATRADLHRFYELPKSRVTVVPHGVDSSLFDLHRAQLDPFVLCVSTLHPHKNLERLIRAYAQKPRHHRLVIAGVRGFHTQAIEQLIDQLGIGTQVQLTGWIGREELYGLYDRAIAFIYPSTFEGFGMPVLEAMAAGVPVACSDIPPLREVAGDTALFFDPLDEDLIAEALDRIVSDQLTRARLIRTGRDRAREFSWQRSAEKTLEVLLSR
jgi:glycosyltransferase involved in cell wall biosynthesis